MSAIEEIIGYIKLLIKNGDIPESYDENEQQISSPEMHGENLIQLNEQRSFDAKVSKDLELDIDPIPHKISKARTFIDNGYISPIAKI